MQLMHESEVPITARDRVYRASRLYAVLFAGAGLALSAVLIWPHGRRTPLPFFGGALLLAILLLHRFVTARFHPSNWLVRMGDQGVFLHFRSYLNDELSADDPTVVFLPFGEIRSARLVKEKVTTPDLVKQNASTTRTVRWIEFELGIDPAPLADALATECGRPAVPVKRWYGDSSTLYLDYPVLMQVPPFLRIKWQVVPGAKAFLNAIRSYVEIAPEVKIAADFSDPHRLSDEQKHTRLHDLDQRGETIVATYLAMRLYGYDLTEATNFVKGLRVAEGQKR
ncbi:MAG TPA: hypothetical protein VGM18_21065 [Candidatus Sulfotelmatobacter sp.]|jgi:hypothetical protein